MRQVFVESRDGTSGTSSNFSITLPQTLALESGHQARVDDLRIPNSLPTVYPGNSGIRFRMGVMEYEVNLDYGQYSSGPDLANEIRNKLQTTTGSWTTQYDARNMSMSISCNNPFEFIGGSFTQRLLARPHDFTGSAYFFYWVPLQGLDQAYLCCSNFVHMDSVGPKGSADCLCAIPFTVAYGAAQTYSMSTSVFFNIPAITTQQLSFQLRDRDYNILSTVPNISFTLTID